jgi:hypothetical protein
MFLNVIQFGLVIKGGNLMFINEMSTQRNSTISKIENII